MKINMFEAKIITVVFDRIIWLKCVLVISIYALTTGNATLQAQEALSDMPVSALRVMNGVESRVVEKAVLLENAKSLGASESNLETYLGNSVDSQQRVIDSELAKKSSAIPVSLSGEGSTEQNEQDEDDKNIEPTLDGSALGRQSLADQSLPFFGYDIFDNIPSAFQPDELGPVDEGYVIGPGDVLRLIVWGATEFQYDLPVDKEGRIVVPGVGQRTVANKTLADSRGDLHAWLSRKYEGMSTDPPTIFIDLTITRIRPIKVFVLGAVRNPGGYTVSNQSTIFNVLYSIGGPLRDGSLRDIQLIRNGKIIERVDIYKFLLSGTAPGKTTLQGNDHIFIPLRGKTVAISGAIKRPAVYELKSQENAADIIKYAGGALPEAYGDRFQIERIVPLDKRKDPSIARTLIDNDLSSVLDKKTKIDLFDGDRVHVFSILDVLDNTVRISGALKQPGSYQLSEGIKTLAGLIAEADGLRGDAYLDKADLFRTEADGTTTIYPVDLNEVLNDNLAYDIMLKPNDRVVIYSIDELMFSTKVSISGKVRNPGNYALTKNMKVYDLLFLGGGLLDPDFLKDVYLDRADLIREDSSAQSKHIIEFDLGGALENNSTISSMLLQPNDQLLIYPKNIEFLKPRTVSIVGKILNPGERPWRSNLRLKDVLLSGEGLYDKEALKDIYLERADVIRTDSSGIYEKIISFNLADALNNEPISNMLLDPDDVIKIYPIDVKYFRPKYVTIRGAVKNPNRFSFQSNMNLLDLIIQAGGFAENAYIKTIEIIRPFNDGGKLKDNTKNTEYRLEFNNYPAPDSISFEIENIDEDLRIAQLFKLEHRDIIYVRDNPRFRPAEEVTIGGDVAFPGEYSLLKDGETLFSIIQRAGGTTTNAFLEGGRFYRNDARVITDITNILRGRKKDDVILLPGDRIIIPSKPNIIRLQGNVQVEGYIRYNKNKRLKGYLDMAGGIKDNSEQLFVIHPNGTFTEVDILFDYMLSNPRIVDGSTIIVTRKPPAEEREEIDYAKIIADSMAFISSTLTILLLIGNI